MLRGPRGGVITEGGRLSGAVRRLARWLVGVAALAAVISTGVVVLAAPGEPEEPPPPAEQLVQLLQQGRTTQYHARYVVRSEGPNGNEPQFSIETWRKPPQVRHDTVVHSPSSTWQTSGFGKGGRVDRCERVNQNPWDCEEMAPPEAATFDDLITSVEEELEDAVVTVKRDRREGTDMDCFTIQHAGDTATEYCVDLDGVVFSIANADAELKRLEITRGFPNSVFTVPTASKAASPKAPIIETVQLPGIVEPLALEVSGAEPTDLRVPGPGAIVLPCDQGGSASHHHLADLELAQGAFTDLRTIWRSNVDLHADGPPSDAFLLPDQSSIALTNQRGSLRLDLAAGECGAPTIAWDGTTASTTGTWTVDPNGTGDAYREATGSGTFTFNGGFAPGNLNPYEFQLDGSLSVLPPGVSAELIRSYWGHLGADYAGRVVTVRFRLTNTGPGDAFSVRLLEPDAPIGFTPVEFFPQVLGDWIPGDSIDVTYRFKVGLDHPSDHKGPLVLRRTFDLTLRLELVDALDRVRSVGIPITVLTPAFPPPL